MSNSVTWTPSACSSSRPGRFAAAHAISGKTRARHAPAAGAPRIDSDSVARIEAQAGVIEPSLNGGRKVVGKNGTASVASTTATPARPPAAGGASTLARGLPVMRFQPADQPRFAVSWRTSAGSG